ncbi:hypothetical protein [Inquilinus limosus]|uniref:hypothetical protein n=1 Tax=Inquilinus limosus TaxID=171674 RepID=UPI00119822F7|nr:hypothetical protein [Inquilinus limosus]
MSRPVSATLALAASGLALLAAGAAQAAATPQETFAKAGFTLCDARLMQKSQGDDSVEQTIESAALQLAKGDVDYVRKSIARGRRLNNGDLSLCPAEEFYGADDIALFAKYWDIPTSEAKRKMSENLVDGYADSIREAIATASDKPAAAGPNETAYAEAGYTMCDARLMQQAFGDRFIKERISTAGEKLRRGDGDIVEGWVRQAREENAGNPTLCPAEESFSEDEIARYAKAKSLTDAAARETIAQDLVDGKAAAVRAAIARAG